jgi:hypothetical protein
MYIPKNVLKPANNSAGAGSPKDPNITIIRTKDIAVWPMRDSNKVNIVGSYVMKAGTKPFTLYMTPSSIKAGFESDGEEDAITNKQKVEGTFPGQELEIDEYVQNNVSEPVIIFLGSCADAYMKVYGTKCAPMSLKPGGTDEQGKSHRTLVFEQYAKAPFVPGHYTGTIPTANYTPVANVTAIVVTDANVDGLTFKLPVQATAAAIGFGAITLPADTIVTIIGSGGATPATLSTGLADKKAILKGGAAWVGLDNAVINLRVFNDGTNIYLIEVNRG